MTSRAKKWAKTAVAALESSGNNRVAAQSRTFFKPHEKVFFWGVTSATVRQIEKDIFRQVSGDWSVKEAISFCDILIRCRFLEAKGLGILLLSRYRKHFDRDLMAKAAGWLSKGWCGNWASTDALAIYVIAPLLSRFPEKLEELKIWAHADTLWLRRAAAVSLIPLCRKGEQLDAAYAIAELFLENREDLMHKAVGWLLREAGKTDHERLATFLIARGSRIPRTALRYAVERFPAKRRTGILRQTRSGEKYT